MRVKTLLTALTFLLVALSGCFGGDEEPQDDDHDHCDHAHGDHAEGEHDCPDDDHGNDGNNTDDGNVTDEPNMFPIPALTMTDGDGNAIDSSKFIWAGGNVTFDATGTTDLDGEIAFVGISINDGETTAQLYADGTFTPATVNFTSVGTFNVTMNVLDDQGDKASVSTQVHVNEVQADTVSIQLGGGTNFGDADDCTSPSQIGEGTITGDQTAKPSTFIVGEGAQWVEATLTSGDGEIAICDPDGNAISGAATDRVVTNEGVNLTSSIKYYVMVLSGNTPNADYGIEVVVHHEPRPADA